MTEQSNSKDINIKFGNGVDEALESLASRNSITKQAAVNIAFNLLFMADKELNDNGNELFVMKKVTDAEYKPVGKLLPFQQSPQ